MKGVFTWMHETLEGKPCETRTTHEEKFRGEPRRAVCVGGCVAGASRLTNTEGVYARSKQKTSAEMSTPRNNTEDIYAEGYLAGFVDAQIEQFPKKEVIQQWQQ